MLIAMLALLGAGALYLFVKQLSASQMRTARDQVTATALSQAKEALIGRALTDNDRPGSLPCPDLVTNIPGNNIPGDGKADLLSGNNCPSYIGWLPWATLGLPDLRDGNGERLWYALSSTLRDDNSVQINSSTAGNLSVDTTMTQIAAIVFAPGPPLSTQTTRPSNNVTDYLEGANADGDNIYTFGPISNSFNDHLLTLSRDELFRAVAKRVAAEVRGSPGGSGTGLVKYYADNHEYPWAASINDGNPTGTPQTPSGFVPFSVLTALPAWLAANDWYSLITYEVAPDFQPGTTYPQQCSGGCLTVGTFTQAQARVSVAGTAVAVCSINPNVAQCP